MNFKLTFFGSLLIGLMVTAARQVLRQKSRANANLSYVDLEHEFLLSHEASRT